MPLFSGTPRFDNGSAGSLAITNEGHLEVAIHDPILPFGSVHTESVSHQIQFDAVYNVLDPQLVQTTALNNGTVTTSSGQFVMQTGTNAAGYAVLQSRHRVRYRPGQGLVGKCTAVFGTPVANSYQLVGFGHAETGLYFGYVGTSFGILHVTGGIREIRTLTVTVGSSHGENVDVELDGTTYQVAVTNSGSTKKTAYEISKGTYTGWTAMQVGATVVFLAGSAGPKTGDFSLAGTSATGTFATTTAGVLSTDTFIPKTSWNVDKMDGTGRSGQTLDPTKGNVYRFDIQYLGFGALVFRVEIVPTNGNSPTFIPVHIIRYPNTYTTPSLSNPAFPFAAIAYNSGSTTNTTLKVASVGAGVEGEIHPTGPRFAYRQSSASISTTLLPMFTIRNDYVRSAKANQTVVRCITLTGAMKHNFSGEVYVVRNATLTGTPDFVAHDTYSCTSVDYSATGVTYAANNQLLVTQSLGDTGNFTYTFTEGLSLQPGETLTVAAKVFSGTATTFVVGLNTREDS